MNRFMASAVLLATALLSRPVFSQSCEIVGTDGYSTNTTTYWRAYPRWGATIYECEVLHALINGKLSDFKCMRLGTFPTQKGADWYLFHHPGHSGPNGRGGLLSVWKLDSEMGNISMCARTPTALWECTAEIDLSAM
jgi:hypothetical protein